MVTMNEMHYIDAEKIQYQGTCLSTDTKPTGGRIANGSILMEMDTGTLYLYDAENEEWRAWA